MATYDPAEWPFPGARWWKCDLHNHTPASFDYGSGPNQAALKARTPKEWLLDYMRAGLDCVAITDHNSGAWIDPLKAALIELANEKPAGYRPLVIIPGVELSIGRIHALVWLDPSKGSGDVEAIIGFAQFSGTRGDSDGGCLNSPTAIAAEVNRLGGLIVPAHADSTKGIFQELAGNDLRPWLDIPTIVGIEMLAQPEVWPSLYQQDKLRWTSVVGSDAQHPNDQGGTIRNYPGSRWTWVKMGAPTIDGLRLALLDGSLSVFRSVSPAPHPVFNSTPERVIAQLEIGSTVVMGNGHPVQLALSPWLNATIGDRGTGKSSFVHFIRQALGRNTAVDFGGDQNRPWTTFSEFMKQSGARKRGVLKPTSQIKLSYLLNGTEFVVTTKGGAKDHVVEERQSDGTLKAASSQEVRDRFKATIVSQDQLTELIVNGREGLLRLVDDETDRVKWQAEWNERQAGYLATSARRRELGAQFSQQDRLKAQQEDIGRKLAQFEGSDHAKVLGDFQRQSQQGREVKAALDQLAAIDNELSALRDRLSFGAVAASGFDPSIAHEKAVLDILARLNEAVAITRASLEAARVKLLEQVDSAQRELGSSQWAEVVKEARRVHQELIDRLRAEGVEDPNQFAQLVEQREVVNAQLNRLQELAAEMVRLTKAREDAVLDLTTRREGLSNNRHSFLDTVLRGNRFVRMKLIPLGDDEERLILQMREWLDLGSSGFDEDLKAMAKSIYKDLPSDFPNRLKEAIRRVDALKAELIVLAQGSAADSKWSGWLYNRLSKSVTERPEFIDRMQSWYPEDTINVDYNAAARDNAEQWKDVDTASAGQRSAALLAFLLSYGDEPIVLDQPEDDLDNQVVFDLVVQGIRQNKRRRQIIVVTHDANIVVNGDAEVVHVMEYRSGQCWLKHSESLQSTSLRSEVCRIMEGGRAAFENRYQRLIESAA